MGKIRCLEVSTFVIFLDSIGRRAIETSSAIKMSSWLTYKRREP